MTKSIPQIAKTSVLTENPPENINLIPQNSICVFSVVSITSKYIYTHTGVSLKFEIQILITHILLRSQETIQNYFYQNLYVSKFSAKFTTDPILFCRLASQCTYCTQLQRCQIHQSFPSKVAIYLQVPYVMASVDSLLNKTSKFQF